MKDLLQSIDEELVPIMEKAFELSTTYGMGIDEVLELIKWHAKKPILEEYIEVLDHTMQKAFTELDAREEKRKKAQEEYLKKQEEIRRKYDEEYAKKYGYYPNEEPLPSFLKTEEE